MKKIILIILIPFSLFFSSCGLMNPASEDKLSGDDFWNNGTNSDVETFILSMYNSFRNATMNNSNFITLTGDVRCAPVIPYSAGSYYVTDLTNNNLTSLITRYGDAKNAGLITKWNTFYEVVQEANILLKEIKNVPGLTDKQIGGYKAEAVFMRSLSYFFMVRAFGDVPYFTNAYNSQSLPRTDMVTILNNCIADLQAVIDGDPKAEYLPWIYSISSKKGVRASRGAALTLMMHMNLWLVKFDSKNATKYYQNVAALGAELVDNNGGVYTLLPISESTSIFRGGSSESFFEIAQNLNSSEYFTFESIFSNSVTYVALRKSSPVYYYKYDFLYKIFPADKPDKRVEEWFDDKIYAIDGTNKEIKKFLNVDTYTGTSVTSNSRNQIVFRYADAILLFAEAEAALGVDDKAQSLVNMIRDRAGAEEFTSTGKQLQDDIYWERVRELIGEGQYYYDLVRTGKLYDANYCYHPITRTQFKAGGWTWPIHRTALENNTYMSLNTYWQ